MVSILQLKAKQQKSDRHEAMKGSADLGTGTGHTANANREQDERRSPTRDSIAFNPKDRERDAMNDIRRADQTASKRATRHN